MRIEISSNKTHKKNSGSGGSMVRAPAMGDFAYVLKVHTQYISKSPSQTPTIEPPEPKNILCVLFYDISIPNQ